MPPICVQCRRSRKFALAQRREYVLPNGSTRFMGYVRGTLGPNEPNASEEDQCISLLTERFSIPEILFNPSDIGRYNHHNLHLNLLSLSQPCMIALSPSLM